MSPTTTAYIAMAAIALVIAVAVFTHLEADLWDPNAIGPLVLVVLIAALWPLSGLFALGLGCGRLPRYIQARRRERQLERTAREAEVERILRENL